MSVGHGVLSSTIALTGSSAALADIDCIAVLVQSDPNNTEDIFLGDSANQHIQLTPGTSLSLDISNTSMLFARAASSSADLNYLVIQ